MPNHVLMYLILCGLVTVCIPPIAEAQFYKSVQEEVDGKNRHFQLLVMTISPQSVSEPALKYKLHWGFDQRIKANAAVKYNMAARELVHVRFGLLNKGASEMQADFDRILTDQEFFKTKKEALEEFEKELATISDDAEKSAERVRHEATLGFQAAEYSYYGSYPREKFPMEKAKAFVSRFQNAYRVLEEASRCDYCDWEYPIRGNRNPIAVTLPEIQECRDLARALQVKCRWEIYEGRIEDAIQTIRIGKTFARHLNETPLIVASLVALSIDGIMNLCLMELIQEPETPNLYWSLTALPHPFFDSTGPFETEMDYVRLMIPELVKAMDRPAEMTDEDWKSLDDSCRFALRGIDDARQDTQKSVLLNLSSMVAYPYAKLWLLEQGLSSTEIEAMPTSKVIGLWSVHRYQVHRDNMLKSITLPHWQLPPFPSEHSPEFSESEKATPLGRLCSILFPATGGYRNVLTRQAAQHEVLRLIEAIRLHAAANEGKLPETLNEITLVPLPNDPYTGKPFDYKIKDGAAIIEFNVGWGIYRTVLKILEIER